VTPSPNPSFTVGTIFHLPHLPTIPLLNAFNQQKYLRVYSGEPAVVTNWIRGRLVYYRLVWPVEWPTYRFIERHPHTLTRDQIDLILDRAYGKRSRCWPGVESVRASWDSLFAGLDGRARRYSEADTIAHGDWETREERELEEHNFHQHWRTVINTNPEREYLYNYYSNLGIHTLNGTVPQAGPTPEEVEGPQPTNSPIPTPPAPAAPNQRRNRKNNNRRRARRNINPPLGTPRDPLQLWTEN
jgi:hypothetical protein